jgi:hypothetical protein
MLIVGVTGSQPSAVHRYLVVKSQFQACSGDGGAAEASKAEAANRIM